MAPRKWPFVCTDYGKPYSKALNVAYMKLDYLEKSRAAGNR